MAGAIATDRPAARDVVKEAIRRRIPVPLAPILQQGKRRYAGVRARAARRAFESAERSPAWLDAELLPRLHERYPRCGYGYGYDPHALARRGAERARVLGRLLKQPGMSTLELACADGMVSYELATAGARATALDVSDALFDSRARDAGVRFVEADAAQIPCAEAQFDLVCSYNAFEHFADPDAVLREAIRVTKPGGTIYLLFGPLYWSSYGLHALRSICVPFCHLLFDRASLESYVDERRLAAIPFETLNGWSLGQFRDLWRRHAASLRPDVYREIPSVHGIDLVTDHPSCFRSKTDDFDNLLVGVIEARFRRLG